MAIDWLELSKNYLIKLLKQKIITHSKTINLLTDNEYRLLIKKCFIHDSSLPDNTTLYSTGGYINLEELINKIKKNQYYVKYAYKINDYDFNGDEVNTILYVIEYTK